VTFRWKVQSRALSIAALQQSALQCAHDRFAAVVDLELGKIFDTWFCAVFSLITNRSAMARLRSPCAIKRSTSNSRLVNSLKIGAIEGAAGDGGAVAVIDGGGAMWVN
jgi:hypothetical protein